METAAAAPCLMLPGLPVGIIEGVENKSDGRDKTNCRMVYCHAIERECMSTSNFSIKHKLRSFGMLLNAGFWQYFERKISSEMEREHEAPSHVAFTALLGFGNQKCTFSAGAVCYAMLFAKFSRLTC